MYKKSKVFLNLWEKVGERNAHFIKHYKPLYFSQGREMKQVFQHHCAFTPYLSFCVIYICLC